MTMLYILYLPKYEFLSVYVIGQRKKEEGNIKIRQILKKQR